MSELNEKAIRAARIYLDRRGHEIVECGWRSEDFGSIDIVSRDDGAIVFTDVEARSGADKGLPFQNEGASRERREAAAAGWLAEHVDDPEYADVTIRFDSIALLLVGENRALLRHHINCLESLRADSGD